MVRKTILTAILVAAAAFWGLAQEFPRPMQPTRLVNDFTGLLTTQEQQALEQKLVKFDNETSTQLSVVTVNDLQGMAVSQYAQRLFDAWGVGGKRNNNGILILVKPKTDSERGEVFIATGYGLEGAVPDALAGRIVDYEILPSFREGRYYEGLDKATTTLMELTRGEYTAEEYLRRKEEGSWFSILFPFLFLIVLIVMFLRRRRRGYTMSSKGTGSSVPPIIFMGRPGGGFGSFTGGGGGFGGFGGGLSGGGGAGGSW